MDIESAIRVCMTCSGKLGRLEDSLAVFHEIVFLNTEQQVTIASRMAIDPVTLRGLVMACGFACKAADWLVYHDLPTTRQSFAALDSEMRQKSKVDGELRHLLFFELSSGARLVLNHVDWGTSAT